MRASRVRHHPAVEEGPPKFSGLDSSTSFKYTLFAEDEELCSWFSSRPVNGKDLCSSPVEGKILFGQPKFTNPNK